ncbi:MAG: methylmalonyl-CoA carboxyltransferase [Treponema sp. GWB1_62_6]|nr:MAG: methylmalonyl-CoA carboxyltransferase [Treponema sp. GWA1_62_8]OHE65870.1 MAG: methylmalonyl-CoA carboxyltransferase [Treponema sp. GWC1_61_84]OHE68776.1 MAG: methylmalonyl-CoA carboxyltransferase [Treponema sp. RIFOXYC1_FULL_61_9]OHE72254.1 MAG: methylmalonyl-CoA carboxyltransferase [Treponema sp. GWB1_62_6]HCM28571.1 methylmalonyl-CoA carboxyltransferase [Treponema sp.]
MEKSFSEKYSNIRSVMLQGGGEKGIQSQHQKGKLTCRERIDLLVDEGSFIEDQAYVLGRASDFGLGEKHFLGDGVITGCGKIDDRQIFLYSQDFTVLGGSLGEMQAERIAAIQEAALKNGCPFVQINDSGGARIQEGVLSLNGYGKIFRNNTRASGVIPQISVILGPCAGGAVYSPAITDFIFMVDGISNMYITGPDVIKAVTGEEITHEALGGTEVHCTKSGVAHFRFSSENECMAFLKRFLGYLPLNNRERPPVVENGDPRDRETPAVFTIIPDSEKHAYDVRAIIEEVFDKDSFIEVSKDYAQNIVVGLARLGGRTVGIFANQPAYLAAVLDINASDKAARFIRFCDAFNIPIVALVDVPGFLPGVAQEHGGIIRHGAKLLYAIAEATVPKVSLILRKSYGGAFISMSSKALGYDRVICYPNTQIAVMGADGAAKVICRKEISESEDPKGKEIEKIRELRESFMNPYVAAGYGFVDDVISPERTRIELIRSLEMHYRKKENCPEKKHGNIPL